MAEMKVLQDSILQESKGWFPGLYGDRRNEQRHMALGMGGEAGEVLNLIKKLDRGDFIAKEDLGDEIADVALYLFLLASSFSFDLEEIIEAKRSKNRERWGKVL
jgi:NTP pyrophosphatase (non-canonical NTP hydrolase)